MENEIAKKVLLIAFSDNSREPAYDLTNELRTSGYATQICNAHSEKSQSKLVADISLLSGIDPSQYSGIIFLDDGGNEDASKKLAKNADDIGLPIGGYSDGYHILHAAKLLKDKFIPKGMPKSEGAKEVNAPAVRSDNIVASAGGCIVGFVLLFVDALGGEDKKVVKAQEFEPPLSAMVISRLERWPEYWELAERLGSKKAHLVLADWDDIDTEKMVAKRFLLLDPAGKRRTIMGSGMVIPKAIWFKQTSIGVDNTIAAVKTLEKGGSVNVNSSESIGLASDKMATAELLDPICSQGNPVRYDDSTIDSAVEYLLSNGVRWAKPINASLGKGVVRVQGRGQTAIISKRFGGKPVHKIVEKNDLTKMLRSNFNREAFMVQDDLGGIHIGDKTFEIRFVMRRLESGWKPSCEISRCGLLISNPNIDAGSGLHACSAQQAIKTAFPNSWQDKLPAARSKAMEACIAFQSGLKDPDGVNELGIDITFDNDQPNVIEINSVPDLTFIDRAAMSKKHFLSLAEHLGTAPLGYDDVPDSDIANSRGDMSGILGHRLDNDKYRGALLREMAHEGMWPQPDGTIVARERERIERMSLRDIVHILKAELRHAAKKVNDIDESDRLEAKRAATIFLRARHRFRLIREWRRWEDEYRSLFKKADYAFNFTGDEYSYGDGTVPGPYSNVRVPLRVWTWQDGDDQLEDTGQIDEETIKNLSRYNPESRYGFYASWDDMHKTDPVPWEDVEKGEGNTPSRYKYDHI